MRANHRGDKPTRHRSLAIVTPIALIAGGMLAATPAAFPLPAGTTPLFMREVADIHRELYAEHGELYGENIRSKVEGCHSSVQKSSSA